MEPESSVPRWIASIFLREIWARPITGFIQKLEKGNLFVIHEVGESKI